MPEVPVRPADAPVAPAVAPRKPRSNLAVIAAVLALAVGLLAALAGLGSRWGLWHFRTGFTILNWAVYGGIAVLVLAAAALVLTRPGGPKRGFPLALLALLVALVVVVVPSRWRGIARSVPPIHDISTDLNNPPEFVDVVPLRADAPNPVEYGGPEIAAQQREAYPEIQPLVLDLPPEEAFDRALAAAREMGWEIVAAHPGSGRIEATDRTFWFGFKDDVVIRITPLGGRTVLDVRSVSRVGRSDVGENARRIREYLRAVQP